MSQLLGQCLCGALKFEVAMPTEIEACHCASCRRWGSGPFVGIEAHNVSFKSDATLKWFKSSDWAQRGFCSECGSTLFYKLDEEFGGGWTVTAGAFDELPAGLSMAKEIFIDSKPDYYEFAGDRLRLTSEQVFAAADAETQS